MSARGNSSAEHAANVENTVETSPEFAKIEMSDTVNSGALQDGSSNVVESETKGEMNPSESQSQELEEMNDQVNSACMVL